MYSNGFNSFINSIKSCIRAGSLALKLVLGLVLVGQMGCSFEPSDQGGPDGAAAVDTTKWVSADQAIDWRPWEEASFVLAQQEGRPLLLYLAAPGCEGIFPPGASVVRSLLEERFVSMWVNPFLRPDIARHYPTGGWPALVLMLPDGRTFAQAVDLAPKHVESYLLRMLDNYERRRKVLEKKIKRAKASVETARFPLDADQVYAAVTTAFDSVRGGFGRGRKFPEAATLRFLLEYGRQSGEVGAWRMVQKSLDALLASPLKDPGSGGFALYSHTPDWATPAAELDAFDQAGLLLVLLEATQRDAQRYQEATKRLLDHVESHFFVADKGYFRGRLVRSAAGTWWGDPAVYADRNARLVSASVRAAQQLGDKRAARMARAAAAFLAQHCVGADGAVYHYYLDGRGGAPGLLEDQALVAQALVDVAGLGEDTLYADTINSIVAYTEDRLFDKKGGAFIDGTPQRWEPLVPFADGARPAGNPLVAELYIRLEQVGRAAAVLAGPRLKMRPSRAHSTGARAVLLCKKAKRTAL